MRDEEEEKGEFDKKMSSGRRKGKASFDQGGDIMNKRAGLV